MGLRGSRGEEGVDCTPACLTKMEVTGLHTGLPYKDGGGFFLGNWESQVVLYSAIVLSLFLYLARKVQHHCFGKNRMCPWLWRSSPAQLPKNLWSPAQWVCRREASSHWGIWGGTRAGQVGGLGGSQQGVVPEGCQPRVRFGEARDTHKL